MACLYSLLFTQEDRKEENDQVLRMSGLKLNGHPEKRLSNTLNLSFEGVEGESLVMNLDIEGIAVSTGSACSEGNVEPSHVLLAMGLSKEQAVSSLRFSLGRFTRKEDIDRVLEVLPGVVERVREIRSVETPLMASLHDKK